MSATSKPRGAGMDPSAIGALAFVAVALGIGGPVLLSIYLGHALAGSGDTLPANPVEALVGIAQGTVAWPTASTVVLAVFVVLALLVGGLVVRVVLRARAKRSRVDVAARYMAKPQELAGLNERNGKKKSLRLGVTDGSAGLPIGNNIRGRFPIFSSYEDCCVDIWGPRRGKTTSRAIPVILAAPGAVLATTNKRDLSDATRGPRSEVGKVWVFDPQGVIGESPDWWWNPLTYVTDENKAVMLADLIADALRDPDAKTDAFFEPAAKELIANLLYAAAIAGRPITQVYLWLTSPTNDEAVGILRAHGVPLNAASLAEVINSPERQRAGVYGSAKQICSFLTNRKTLRWVAPLGEDDTRPQFDPAEFVRTRGTLYSISKEGKGTAGPLVAALTVAVCEAAEELASRSPQGRLPVPMVVMLDEAANVCRWRELPNIYSHYGSRGICLFTILQSWSQGVEVWGRTGMRKLWSAANIKFYGGGVSETEFLGELSQLIGDFDQDSVSVSTSPKTKGGGGGRSRSVSSRRERILDIADLTALPDFRGVVLSGAPATLVSTVPWMAGPFEAAVTASILANDPHAVQTLTEAGVAVDARTTATAEPTSAPSPANPWVIRPRTPVTPAATAAADGMKGLDPRPGPAVQADAAPAVDDDEWADEPAEEPSHEAAPAANPWIR